MISSTVLLKKIILAFLFSLLAYVLFFQFYQSTLTTINPSSSKNDFLSKLSTVLSTANIKTSQITLRDFQNETEFYVQNENFTTKVVLSTAKDPYQQVASLQKILKIAKIKGKDVKFIDLSIGRSYATF